MQSTLLCFMLCVVPTSSLRRLDQPEPQTTKNGYVEKHDALIVHSETPQAKNLAWEDRINRKIAALALKVKDIDGENLMLLALAGIIVVLLISVFVVLMTKNRTSAAWRSEKRTTARFAQFDEEEDSGEASESGSAMSSGQQFDLAASKGAKNCEFPNVLGPFALYPTNWSAPDLKVVSEADGKKTWSISKGASMWSSNDDLGLFFDSVEEWPIKGRLGPVSPISTFPVDSADSATVLPPGAKTFGWSHPVDFKYKALSDDILDKVSQWGVTDLDFLIHGAFVFYNSRGAICGVRTVGVASQEHASIQFDAPTHWDEKLSSKMKDALIKVTNSDTKAKGAVYHNATDAVGYSWVSRGDPVLSMVEAPTAPYGGFMFRCDQPVKGMGRNIIFPLQKVMPPGWAATRRSIAGAGLQGILRK